MEGDLWHFMHEDPPQDNQETLRELSSLTIAITALQRFPNFENDLVYLDLVLRKAQLEFVCDLRDGVYEGKADMF